MRLVSLAIAAWILLAPTARADETPCAEDVRRICERLTTTTGGSFWSQFRDPQDDAFDTSQWLASKTGFLPVPIARDPEEWAFYFTVGNAWLGI